jgi:hypothetical protein
VGSELFRRCREEDAGSDGGTSNALEPKGGASPKQKEKYGKIAPTWEGSLHLALDLFKKIASEFFTHSIFYIVLAFDTIH